jgi:hypothetical protein
MGGPKRWHILNGISMAKIDLKEIKELQKSYIAGLERARRIIIQLNEDSYLKPNWWEYSERILKEIDTVKEVYGL